MQIEVYTAQANGKLTPYNPQAQEKLTINTVYGSQGSAILASEGFFVGEIVEDDYTDYDWRYLKAVKKKGSLNSSYILIVMDYEAENVLETAISKRGNAYYYINPLKQDTGSGGSGSSINWGNVGQILLDIGKQVAKEIDLKDIIGGGGGGSGTGTGAGGTGTPDCGWGSGTGTGTGSGGSVYGTVSSVETYPNRTVINADGVRVTVEEPGEKLPTAAVVAGAGLLLLMGYITFVR